MDEEDDRSNQYVGIEEDFSDDDYEEEDLSDIWREMEYMMECSKLDADEETPPLVENENGDGELDCDHLFFIRDDIGEVCSRCGVVARMIDTIIEYNFVKENVNKYQEKQPREL